MPRFSACAAPPDRAPAPALTAELRSYMSTVYPAADTTSLSPAAAARLLLGSEWFYGAVPGAASARLPPAIASELSLITPKRYKCDDGFFGAGLLQRDVRSRFPAVLPCTPGTDCIQRQAANLPRCSQQVAAAGSDLWLEVWHMAFDGRMRPRKPCGDWGEFLDHGQAGWWYVNAPGSGVFYHAGRTLAAPSKASMLAQLLEAWVAIAPPPRANAARAKSAAGGGSQSTGGGERSDEAVSHVDRRARQVIRQFAGDDPAAVARTLRRLEAGVPCRNVSWGRWRCVGDFLPNDNWDPLLLTLGRALKYDSLLLHTLTWGRTLGSTARLTAIAQNKPPPVEPPYSPITDAEFTSEVVDLRLPPPPYDTSLVVPEPAGEQRVRMAEAWAAQVLASTPPRLSLRDPFNPADETRARPCHFNASGGPTVRLACHGHISWEVRHETQHQQTCTRRSSRAHERHVRPASDARGE